jgi:ribosomal protein L34
MSEYTQLPTAEQLKDDGDGVDVQGTPQPLNRETPRNAQLQAVERDTTSLPPGWQSFRSRTNGETYYRNAVRGVSQWEFPAAAPHPAAAAAAPSPAPERTKEKTNKKTQEEVVDEEDRDAADKTKVRLDTSRGGTSGTLQPTIRERARKLGFETRGATAYFLGIMEDRTKTPAECEKATDLLESVLDDVEWFQKLEQIQHGTFRVEGEATVRHYVFAPPGLMAKVEGVRMLLELWNISPPNLLLQTNANPHQADELLYPANWEGLRTEDEKKKNTEMERSFKWATPDPEPDEDSTDDTRQQANELLYTKLLVALEGVVTAAEMTDSWLLSKGYAYQNQELLSTAIKRSNASPRVVVVDNPLWLLEGWGGSVSEPPSSHRGADAGGWSDAKGAVQDTNSPEIDRYEGLVPMEKYIDDSQSFLNKLKENAVSWTDGTGEPVVVSASSLARGHRNRKDGHAEMPARRKSNGHWSAGTHYVFMADPETFNDAALGPSGYICIGGGYKSTEAKETGCAYAIKRCIDDGLPCVLFDCTGAETQEYARLRDEILRVDKEEEDLEEQARALLKKAQNRDNDLGRTHEKDHWSQRKGANALTLPDVLHVIDKHRERPQMLQDTVVSVNPFTATTETVLRRLSLAFASVYLHAHEVGGGTADDNAILAAWRLHRMLAENGTMQRRSFDTIGLVVCFCTFLSSATAVLVTSGAGAGAETVPGDGSSGVDRDMTAHTMNLAVLIFPALGALCSAFVVMGKFDQKRANLEMGAAKVLSNIYLFRTRCGAYTLTQAAGDDNHSTNASVMLHSARQRFSERTRQIVLESGLRAELVLVHSEPTSTPIQLDPSVDQNDTGGVRVETGLAKHIVKVVQPLKQSAFTVEIAQDDVDPEPGSAGVTGDSSQTSLRVQVGAQIRNPTNADYYRGRVLPMLEECRKRAPQLRRLTFLLDFLVLLSGSIATILAALELAQWIPLVVSYTQTGLTSNYALTSSRQPTCSALPALT